jgi:hypothetical protein
VESGSGGSGKSKPPQVFVAGLSPISDFHALFVGPNVWKELQADPDAIDALNTLAAALQKLEDDGKTINILPLAFCTGVSSMT